MKNYAAIYSRALELNLPVTYQTDLLVHDMQACERNPESRRFIWALSARGTNMVWLDPCSIQFSTMSARSLIDYFGDCHLHYWDGTKLHSIDADTAVGLLA